MWKGKSLLDYVNLFSSKKNEKYDKIILKYWRGIKSIALGVRSIENLIP